MAAIALVVSIVALRNARRISAEGEASTAYRQYLDLVLRYPELMKATDEQRYEWLMHLYLFMCQTFFRAYSEDEVWEFLKQDLDNDIDRELLRRWYDGDKRYFRRMFGRSVEQLVRSVLKGNK
jgi:hypothetical protein